MFALVGNFDRLRPVHLHLSLVPRDVREIVFQVGDFVDQHPKVLLYGFPQKRFWGFSPLQFNLSSFARMQTAKPGNPSSLCFLKTSRISVL